MAIRENITIMVAEPPSAGISDIVITPVKFSLATDDIIEYLKSTGGFDERGLTLHLRNIPMPHRLDVLDKLVHMETCAITMLSPDEFLNAVPAAREKHNAFFSKINTSLNIMAFKEKSNSITPEEKELKYNSILLSCSKHSIEMEKLYNESEVKFL